MYRWQDHNHVYWPDDFKFRWPVGDEKLAGDIHTLTDLDEHVFPLVEHAGVAVQAGGAMGMWPKRMAQVFDTVYTFEPNPQSFNCLVHNCQEENIVKIQAALGDQHSLVTMAFHENPNNYGAYQCKRGGVIPTFKIDELALDRCDLIMLDIEGYELFALRGAEATIDRYRPVIVLEDKGCSAKYGYNRGDVERHLKSRHKYSEFIRIHNGRDVICR